MDSIYLTIYLGVPHHPGHDHGYQPQLTHHQAHPHPHQHSHGHQLKQKYPPQDEIIDLQKRSKEPATINNNKTGLRKSDSKIKRKTTFLDEKVLI